MSRLSWHEPTTQLFETGADRGVFYPSVGPGISWSGLLSVQEVSGDASAQKQYLDGVPYSPTFQKEDFGLMIRALYSPKEFDSYDGTRGLSRGIRRPTFDFSYRTMVGDATVGIDRSYLIHLVYNATATLAKGVSTSLTKTVTPSIFEWSVTTKPHLIPGARPSAHLIIDSSIVYPDALQALEDILYGTEGSDARLPSPEELLPFIESFSILLIVDHGDGSWSAIGPDDVVQVDGDIFSITWPSVVYLDADTYNVSSL